MKKAGSKPGKRPARPAKREETRAAEPSSPRQKMVLAAIGLFSERGLSGTSFSEVIERSGAPRGSIYHHFPEGKDALAAEAIALVGGHLVALLRRRDGATARQVVHRFVDAWRKVLVDSGCAAGCAIAAITHEQEAHAKLGAQAAAVFLSWEHELTEALLAARLGRARAKSAAALTLASVEGALILCRARKDTGPIDAVREALGAFVEG